MTRVPGLLATLALLAAGCASPERPVLPRPTAAGPAVVKVGTAVASGTVAIATLPIEEYVLATILSEFAPASGDPAVVERMFEVQAVISRTYAVASLGRHAADGYDLCSSTHCQLFEPSRVRSSRWAPAAGEAVARTAGSLLWYEGGVATAFFHADCGGHTSRPVDVWGGRAPAYLTAIRDDGPAGDAHAAWRYQASIDEVRQALARRERTRVEVLDEIAVLDRDEAGRAAHVALRGRTSLVVRGEDLRDALTRAFGPRAIRSTRFDVRREGRTIVFTGTGFGHGVGLCQAGALARLRAGADPAAVLARYFPGTTLERSARQVAVAVH